MNDLIAYCGINCKTCPLYEATISNDASLKHELALKWGKLYNRDLEVSQMHCNGCKSGDRFFMSHECDIAACNTRKGIDMCKQCAQHPCDRMKRFYEWQKKNDTQVEVSNE